MTDSTITLKASELGREHIGYKYGEDTIYSIAHYPDGVDLQDSDWDGFAAFSPDDEVTLTEPKCPWHDWHPEEVEAFTYYDKEGGISVGFYDPSSDYPWDGYEYRETLMEHLDDNADPTTWKTHKP